MVTKCWVLVLSVAVSLIWLTAPPTQAAGESWSVLSVKNPGCDGTTHYTLNTALSGLDGGSYWVHMRTTSNGLNYANEGYDAIQTDGPFEFDVDEDYSYGDLPDKGAWPIPPGHPLTMVLTLERPQGTVLSSWTVVASSCDSAALLYNGPTSADPDHDYKAAPADKCPTLKAFTSTGCPLRDRTLTLKAKYGPRRVIGRLYAPGYPSLYANRTVTIWKKRAGPDRLVATRTTNSLGQFRKKVRAGRYYATAPGLIVAAAGQAAADTSPVRRLR